MHSPQVGWDQDDDDEKSIISIACLKQHLINKFIILKGIDIFLHLVHSYLNSFLEEDMSWLEGHWFVVIFSKIR